MSVQKLNHISIAVPDLEAAMERFGNLLGSEPSPIETISDQQVRLCFFELGETRIELISPLPENKGVNGFLEKRGPGLHHICLEVDDIEVALDEYRDAGLRLIDEKPRLGADGRRIAFVHPSATDGVLIELVEQS